MKLKSPEGPTMFGDVGNRKFYTGMGFLNLSLLCLQRIYKAFVGIQLPFHLAALVSLERELQLHFVVLLLDGASVQFLHAYLSASQVAGEWSLSA